jgi:hypothetical protein
MVTSDMGRNCEEVIRAYFKIIAQPGVTGGNNWFFQ